ncbi:MAG TPA: hypothetical protein VGL11_02605 [Candidatus Binatia bacterium]|jgi:hypothetical protein
MRYYRPNFSAGGPLHHKPTTTVFGLSLSLLAAAALLGPAALHPTDQKLKRVAPIHRRGGFHEKKMRADAEREALESGRPPHAEDQGAAAPAPRIPSVTSGFAGMNFIDGGGSVPPDTIAATGPDHIVEAVNATLAIFDRATGTKLSQQSLFSFFGSTALSDCIFDPVVAYDESAERFYIGALDVPEVCNNTPVNTVRLLYAVSDSSDPTDGFAEKHAIDLDEISNAGCGLSTPVGGDFTRTGWNADAHVFTFNMFDFNDTCFDHVSVIVINKSNVLDANSATAPTVLHADRSGPAHFTLIPAAMHGSSPGGPMWLAEESDAPNKIRVVKMTSILTAPTFSDTDLSVAAYGAAPNATQKGGGFTIDTGDTSILHAEWRGDRLVAAQTVGFSGAVNARWYEFDTSGAAPVLTQQGTISPGSGIDTYYPSIAIAASGDLGMTFMQSSKNQFMSMYLTGQSAGDPPGTMQTPILAKAGERNYTAFDCTGSLGCRAGDYSGITVDPNAANAFCAANEYATSAASENWGTWISCFSLAPIHDLAVTAMTVPKKARGSPVTLPVTVTIQNRSEHNETIFPADLGDGATSGLARLSVSVVDDDGESCAAAQIALNGVKNAALFPGGLKLLAMGQTMTVNFLVTYNCSGAAAGKQDPTPGDYSHTATVHHEVLSGASADTHGADDACPRPILPGGFDPNPPPSGTPDKGCGPKKSPGAPIVVNVTP